MKHLISGKQVTRNQKRIRNNNVDDEDDEKSGNNVDLISGLPNDILVYILSFVEMKTAARTSLVSKRWRYVWTYLTDLEFNISDTLTVLIMCYQKPVTSELDRFTKWVNQVIATNRASYLNTFRIHCALYGLYAAEIDGWLKFALRKKVRNLELNLSIKTGYGLGDPGNTNTSSFCYFLSKWPNHDYNSNLKSLHLEAVVIVGSLLESALSNCVSLERLMVRRCSFYLFQPFKVPLKKELVVLSLSLKHLELSYCCYIESFQISAPKLTSFVFFAGSEVKVEYTSFPSLVDVTSGYIFQNLHVFADFSYQLEKLSLFWNEYSPAPTGLAALPKVKQLEFTVYDPADGDDKLLALISVIEACPLLHTFRLKLLLPWTTQKISSLISLSAVKKDVINVIRAHEHLKTVEFVGFTGSASSVELALCLAEHAPLINKFIFDPYYTGIMGEPCKWYGKPGMDRIDRSKTQAELLAKRIRGLGVDVVMIS